MKIGFIGAGKVCNALSAYFKIKHEITGICSRTLSSAKTLAQKLNCPVFVNAKELIIESELIFLSTTDGQIPVITNEIADLDIELSAKAFAHLSGSLSSSILEPLSKKGAITFSLHPLQSFSNPDSALPHLPHTIFTTEGNKGHKQILEQLFQELPNQIIGISANDKCRYHIAAVILSNYLVTLYGIAEELLKNIGIEKEQIRQLLIPLLHSTTVNIEEKGFDALTGPLQRGDTETILRHLEDLSDSPDILTVYKALARESLNLLEKESKINTKELKDLLNNNKTT